MSTIVGQRGTQASRKGAALGLDTPPGLGTTLGAVKPPDTRTYTQEHLQILDTILNTAQKEKDKKQQNNQEELARLRQEEANRKKTAAEAAASAKKASDNAKEKQQRNIQQKQQDKQEKTKKISHLVYRLRDVFYKPSKFPTKEMVRIITPPSIIQVDGEFYKQMPLNGSLCQYCDVPLLFADNTVADHDTKCPRYNNDLYKAAIDLIRIKGNYIKNSISNSNNIDIDKIPEDEANADNKFKKLLAEQDKKEQNSASAAEAPASKNDFIVGPCNSTPKGYRRVTKNDILERYFAKKLDISHGDYDDFNDRGLDIVPYKGMDIADVLHIKEGKLLVETSVISDSEISCLDNKGNPKKPGTTLYNVKVYHFHLADGSTEYIPKYSVKKSTVTSDRENTTPCLFIGNHVNITRSIKAKETPINARGGRQKCNKTHRKYYSKRNKKHTRRH